MRGLRTRPAVSPQNRIRRWHGTPVRSRSVTGPANRFAIRIRRPGRPGCQRPRWSSKARENGCSVTSRRSACHVQDRWPAAPSTSSAEMRAWQHYQAISPASRRIRQEVRGRTKAEVREKLQALHRELEAGLRVSATYTVASCIRDWLDDGPTTRQASTVENYRRLADHAIGKLGAVKVKDLTARQVQKALAELSVSLSTRSLRPPLLSTRLTRSLAHGEQLHWQPVVDRRGRSLRSPGCLARPQPCLPT